MFLVNFVEILRICVLFYDLVIYLVSWIYGGRLNLVNVLVLVLYMLDFLSLLYFFEKMIKEYLRG